MKAVFQPGLMPLERCFDTRIAGLYSAMVQRFRERKFKSGPRKGQIFRAAMTVPFSREEFLTWVEHQLGGKNGTAFCAYCRAPLDARTVAIDHEYPIKQGGHLGLANLVCCCQPCNKYKGSLTPLAFGWLREQLVQQVGKYLSIADAKDIEMRLRSGGGFYKTSKKAKEGAAALKAQKEKDEEPF